ncbi:DNA methyltransferase [Chryseobacterium sp.]|uniref:DNA methyltransferase n=1 Tax=Chryseobacterium sp. TaxID=1871047 RepID=UPI002FC998DD
MEDNIQVKSKKRVADHGEVFTNEREVNAMLDMVRQETERIDSRFLEPACGSGNFLVEILRRKLSIVKNRYKKSQIEYERYAIIAITSVYGVDILEDNVLDCRQRLQDVFSSEYKMLFKSKCKKECLESAQYILSKNILWGDALTMLRNDGEPIVFAEWSPFNGSLIKRRDFTLSELLTKQQYASEYGEQKQLWLQEAALPKPIKEYPLIHFLKVKDYE